VVKAAKREKGEKGEGKGGSDAETGKKGGTNRGRTQQWVQNGRKINGGGRKKRGRAEKVKT